MPYLDPTNMRQEQRTAFLEWLKNEGIDPFSVANDGKFSVHKGRISGNRFLLTQDNKLAFFKDAPVTVPFTKKQKHPLPDSVYSERVTGL